MKTSRLLLSCFVLLILCAAPAAVHSQTDEKSRLLASSWGDFRNAKKEQKPGAVLLQEWPPHVEYQKQIRSGKCVKAAQTGRELYVVFDEIWTIEDTEHLSKSEIRQKRGKLNIRRLIWLDNKIQAWTLEKYYAFDPVTRQRVGKHQITRLVGREEILSGL